MASALPLRREASLRRSVFFDCVESCAGVIRLNSLMVPRSKLIFWIAFFVVAFLGCTHSDPTSYRYFKPSSQHRLLDVTPCSTLADLARTYGLDIVLASQQFEVDNGKWIVQGSAPHTGTKAYAQLFAAEFSVYPPNLVRRAYLRRIIFCQDLYCEGLRRGIVPDFISGDLYVDILGRGGGELYKRSIIHHEFFHMINYQADGLSDRDDRWSSLNTRGFKYGRGGWSVQDVPGTSILSDDYPGFLNHFSMSAMVEDKAEIFSHMIVDSAYMKERIARDPIVGAKVQRMKEFLEHYCKEVDESFWLRAQDVKRADQGSTH